MPAISNLIETRQSTLQTGIRQRSLRRHCRLGRATELVFVLVTGVTLTLGGQVQAQTWDAGAGGSNADWSAANNWDPNGVPGAGGNVIINGAGGAVQPVLNVNSAVLTSTTISGGSLTVNNALTSPIVTVSGNGRLVVASTGSVVGNVSFGSSNSTSSNAGTITGNLSVSSGAFTNTGAVTGTTGVSGGQLNLNAGTNLGDAAAVNVSGTGTLTVNAADTVGVVTQTGGTINGAAVLTAGSFSQSGGELSTGATITSAGAKTLSGGTIAGTLNGSGATTVQTGTTFLDGTITGDVDVDSGVLNIGAGTVTGNVTLSGQLNLGNSLAVTGSISTGTGAVIAYLNGVNEASGITLGTANTTMVVLGSDSATQSGLIEESVSGSGITKNGTGSLTLTQPNTFTGAVNVLQGTLAISNAGALGTGTGGTIVSDGATLALSGGISVSEAITLNGTGIADIGALRSVSGNNEVTSEITLGSSSRINSDTVANTLTLSGGITGTNTNLTIGGAGDTNINSVIDTGTGSLTKDGTGNLTISGANTFTGATTLNAGTITAAGGSALSDTALLTVNGGVLGIATSETVGNIAGTGGSIAIITGQTLTAGDATNSTFSGGINDNSVGAAGNFTKAGTGTLELSGISGYTGATEVNGGVLNVTGSLASLSNTVNADGTLRVDGLSLADTAEVTLVGNDSILDLTGSETIGALNSASTTSSVTLGANTLTTGDAGNDIFAGVFLALRGLTVTRQGTGTFS